MNARGVGDTSSREKITQRLSREEDVGKKPKKKMGSGRVLQQQGRSSTWGPQLARNFRQPKASVEGSGGSQRKKSKAKQCPDEADPSRTTRTVEDVAATTTAEKKHQGGAQ